MQINNIQKNKVTKLSEEELELEEELKKGEWKTSNETEKNKIIKAAKNWKRSKRINIRVTDDILIRLKDFAHNEGIPYQTLIYSILYKFAYGRLIDHKIHQ
jgi:predicted DNA binding CopG/RHH family protein